MKSQIFENFLDMSMYRQIQFKIVLRFFCSTPIACYLWPEEKGFLSRWETHALTWKRISISCVHFCLLLLPQGWRIRNHYTLLFFTGKTFPLEQVYFCISSSYKEYLISYCALNWNETEKKSSCLLLNSQAFFDSIVCVVVAVLELMLNEKAWYWKDNYMPNGMRLVLSSIIKAYL